MRYITVLVSLLFVNLSQACSEASASQQQDVIGIISAALGKGDAEGIASFFPKSVSMAILQKTPAYYSQAQAKQMLTNFFEQHKPQRFEKAHAGGKGNSKFTMGDLRTSAGVFRVTFFLKEAGGKLLIKNLIIDKK